MKSKVLIILLVPILAVSAELPYKLPLKAKYTASKKSISEATEVLNRHLIAETNALTNLFIKPVICGPGLWHALKDSPRFSKPPFAKSTAKVPLPDGKLQELPCALLQDDAEVISFRAALAELLASQGKLTIRAPTKDEFMVFWAVFPFDKMDQPLLVAEGKDYTIICLFGKKGNVFWTDEVKKMHFKK